MAEVLKKEVITDETYIANWRSMLKIFHDTIEGNPAPDKVRETLTELSEAATHTFYLTPAQKSGITERCANYLNGSYGRNLSTPK